MARTRIFISSTYYDLRFLRASLGTFLQAFGFDVVMNERGAIPYDHQTPLDESCYAEVNNADMLILIVGGRAGAAASFEPKPAEPDVRTPLEKFFTQYESITKGEYERAHARGIPVHAFVEASVFHEYNTYKKNVGNKEIAEKIAYFAVENVNVFRLLDEIYSKPINRTVQHFEDVEQIQSFLREQFSGSYRDMLVKKSQAKQLTELREQVQDLRQISETMKLYLEQVLSQNPQLGEFLVSQRRKEDSEEAAVEVIKNDPVCKNLIRRVGLSVKEFAVAFLRSDELATFTSRINDSSLTNNAGDIAMEFLTNPLSLSKVNELRRDLCLPEFEMPKGSAPPYSFILANGAEVVFRGIAAEVATTVFDYAKHNNIEPFNVLPDDERFVDFADSHHGLTHKLGSREKAIEAAKGVVRRLNREYIAHAN